MRLRAAAALACAAVLLAGCGGGPGAPTTQVLGKGPQEVTIIRPAGPPDRLPVVLFLHGWGATLPDFYRPWLHHLARQGNAVVYPRYQESFATPPREALGNVLAGVRAAFGEDDLERDGLVIVGHSAGGALAADYAGVAGTAGLPVPEAILAAYPGRRLERVPVGIPQVGEIPDGVEVIALGSEDDVVVGTDEARRIGRDGRYVEVAEATARDHQAPQRDDPAARRAFWAPLDALIARVRRR